jgi:hypothetical protein
MSGTIDLGGVKQFVWNLGKELTPPRSMVPDICVSCGK